MMSPKTSPNGIEVKRKVRVKRINRKALGLGIAALSFSLMLLFTAVIENKEKRESESEKKDIPSTQLAMPPQNIEKSSRLGTEKAEAMALASGGSSGPAIDLEEAEFEKEIRRDRRRAYLSKLATSDNAMMSDVKVDNGYGKGPSLPDSESKEQPNGDRPFKDLAGSIAANAGLSLADDPNMQGRKEAFSERQKMSGYLPERKRAPLSPYEIKTGTVIPMVLISGINSDLPGQIIAQVSETVYDTATGQYPLIPQGSRLVGSYDSFVALGQEGALVAWHRLIFPDGSTLELLNMPGADKEGFSGFRDLVDNHYLRTFGNAILLSLVGSAYQISQPKLREGEALRSSDIVASQLAQNLSQISGEQIRRNMQVQPNIIVRTGYEGLVMVNKDIILEPLREE